MLNNGGVEHESYDRLHHVLSSQNKAFEYCTVIQTSDARCSVVPSKSKKTYLREHDRFTRFRNSLNLRQDSDRTVFTCFENEKQVHGAKAATVWKRYSTVKCILQYTKHEFYVFSCLR